MKRMFLSKGLFILWANGLAILSLSACHKHSVSAPPPTTLQGKMEGNWNIITVTTILHDSTGAAIPGDSVVYPQPAGEYFQFKADGSWKEVLFADSTGIEYGSYSISSDSSFTLLNAQLPGATEPCTIGSLSASHFVFSHNGPPKMDQHYIHYVFDMTR